MKILVVGGAGYCGTYLTSGLAIAGHQVATLDLRMAEAVTFWGDYRRHPYYAQYDAVLWFAGPSSVVAAKASARETLDSGVVGLVGLREKMREDALLIYASSASVYDSNKLVPVIGCESDPVHPAANLYDRSKFAFDYIQEAFLPNCLGLRMGTVCGWSRPCRMDTVFNKMNLDAIDQGQVSVSNPNNWRSLLWLEDLLEVVKLALEARPTGLINVASCHRTIGDLADEISTYHNVPVVEAAGQPSTYSYYMGLAKMHRTLEPALCGMTISEACARFKESYANGG